MSDTIRISKKTAEAFNCLGIGEFYEEMTPESMAFVGWLLPYLDDNPKWFPKGKYAVIQHIQSQLIDCAMKIARDINELANSGDEKA